MWRKGKMSDDFIPNIYFSDYFGISPRILEEYGAFNVSLLNDLPLFVDPFLLFNSQQDHYQQLHKNIIRYLRFLRDKSIDSNVNRGLLLGWFVFSEIKQNWLGFSRVGNQGSGLGPKFAYALHENLSKVFSNFGQEKITQSSHLEKLTLISDGVGRDNISDFTTNLIKRYLLEYTQTFAQNYISPKLRKKFHVRRIQFDYELERWTSGEYDLPCLNNDYIILTPLDILTKDEIWINRDDMVNDYSRIVDAVPNQQLRAEINNYFERVIPKDAKEKERRVAIARTYRQFPELIEHFIRYKEDNGDEAIAISDAKVEESKWLYIDQVKSFVLNLFSTTPFYNNTGDTLEEARSRVMFMKHIIENQDGYRLFYINDEPIKRESDLQLIFKFTWYASPSDINAEVNNGRGPVDFKVSRGALDKSLIEFKLASNSQLKRNLQNQVEIYKLANNTMKALKVIIYFNVRELAKLHEILDELELNTDNSIILIDARADNKPSASKA